VRRVDARELGDVRRDLAAVKRAVSRQQRVEVRDDR
jgi:hypothetical protein